MCSKIKTKLPNGNSGKKEFCQVEYYYYNNNTTSTTTNK